MELKGELIYIGDVESYKQGSFKKRTICIEMESKYPQKVALVATQDKIQMTDEVDIGDIISVSFNPQSNEYKSKWYTELRVSQIKKLNDAGDKPPDTQDDEPF